MKKIILLIISLSIGISSFSQIKQNKKKAYEIAKKAVKYMDDGDFKKSIELLQESQKLDSNNSLYPYEIGYAYFLQKKYKKAIELFHETLKYKDINDQHFTMLGNIYDIDKQPKKAIEIYKQGLIKFPNSGRLYFEQGNVLEVLEKYEEALKSWENGIEVSPSYPSNYHTASIYYCKYTDEKIWGVLYGEVFMNIERGSKKTEKISNLLFETYKSSITYKSKKKIIISFSKSNQIIIPKDGEKIVLPFSMPFEITMALASTSELHKKNLDIKSFNKIRTTFIKSWYEHKQNEDYPNILFDWHKKLIKLNYFEAYNYWLLMKGNEKEFDKWLKKNQSKFDEFINWFSKYQLIIDKKNNFHRLQYN